MGVMTLLCRVLILSLLTLIPPSTLISAAQTEEQLIAEINQLPEAARQTRLVNGARKEGSVVWYAAMNRTYAQDLVNAFETQYPFLKVNVLTGGGGALINRVLTENRAKSYQYDLFNTRSMTLNTMKKAGAIMRNRTPYRNFLRPGSYDGEGYFNGLFATPMVFLFNSRFIKSNEAPETFTDLLNPKWTGKLAIDDESFDWLIALMEYYGKEKGIEIATKIGNQKLNVRRGPTLLAQLVAAGEFYMVIDGFLQEALAKKSAGAPLDYRFPQPFVPVKTPSALYMSSHPPHPHAAALMVDFLLSKKGQDIMHGHGRWVSYKTVTAKGPDDVRDQNVIIPSPEKWGDNYNDIIALYKRILLHQ